MVIYRDKLILVMLDCNDLLRRACVARHKDKILSLDAHQVLHNECTAFPGTAVLPVAPGSVHSIAEGSLAGQMLLYALTMNPIYLSNREF